MALITVNPRVNTDRRITRLAFLSRFEFEELVAIDLASIGSTPEAAQVRSVMLISNSASYIDLSRKDTQDGVNRLVFLGVITQERADMILNNDVEKIERPTT